MTPQSILLWKICKLLVCGKSVCFTQQIHRVTDILKIWLYSTICLTPWKHNSNRIKIEQIHISYKSSHLYVLWIASSCDIRLKVMGKFRVPTGLLEYWIGQVTTGESLFPNIFGWLLLIQQHSLFENNGALVKHFLLPKCYLTAMLLHPFLHLSLKSNLWAHVVETEI